MSTIAEDVATVHVSDRVEPGLTVRGPYGSGEPMVVRSPWDGAEIATIRTTTLDEADDVLSRARAAAEAFRWTPAWKRAEILERASHLIEDNAEQIARIIAAEGGKPLKDARIEARRGASTFRWAAEESKRTAGDLIEMDADPSGEHRFGWTIREPRGVIVAISPFNFPLNLVAHKVAPAIAGGNVVVLKPASSTPLTALRLAELLAEAGLPRNVLQVVVGPGQHARHQARHRRARQHGHLHRQPAGGQADRARRRHEDGDARAGQQLGDHRRRGRQPRPRRPARGRRRLRQLRSGVHLRAARRGAPEGVRRVHGQARTRRERAEGRRPAWTRPRTWAPSSARPRRTA